MVKSSLGIKPNRLSPRFYKNSALILPILFASDGPPDILSPMKRIRILSVAYLFFFGLFAFAQLSTPNQEYAGQTTMNGYSLKEFKDFEKNWNLVTIRFRKDTNEMRWTFANDLAWKVLESGSVEYPEGAAFAKIGIATSEDPQFISSAIPVGARRYQFMVRNVEKHAETGGWGYALFDVDGKTFPEEPRKAAMACFACHKIVENRGQVFSQPFQFSPHNKGTYFSSHKAFRKIGFSAIKLASLNKDLQKLVAGPWKEMREVSDKDMRENLFQGTLEEIRPSLEREAYESKLPAALISKDQKRFSIIIPTHSETCKEGRSFKSIMTMDLQPSKKGPKVHEYCNP